jgi:SAM-dependent methyltransferase
MATIRTTLEAYLPIHSEKLDMSQKKKQRQPHAALDLPSRRLKALKIEHLLDLSARPQPLKLLEVGTGSGGIAHYFGTHPTLRCEVHAVDVTDQRLLRNGYVFHHVEGISLPFHDGHFDVVITNHVIEHVGGLDDQRNHLREVHRVMNSKGVGYLAVPNRWMLVEPHYRLAFLSWLPLAWRTPYLRAMKRGMDYDCNPVSLPELEGLLADAQFLYENISVRALRETLHIEGSKGPLATVAARLPDAMLNQLSPINPTLIYKLTRL